MSLLATHEEPTLTLVGKPSRSAQVLIVGLASAREQDTLLGVPEPLAAAGAATGLGTLLELASSLGATSERGQLTTLPVLGGLRIVVVGVGEVDVTPVALREAIGAATRVVAAKAEQATTLAISLELTDPELIQAAAEGALLGGYEYRKLSSSAARNVGITAIEVVSTNSGADAKQAIARAASIAEATNLARDWINTPANLLYPETFAAEAVEQFKSVKNVSVEVLDEKALAKGGYGGLMAVGGGSSRGPRLVRVDYKPRGAKARLALVGKGITFDSGGLNIKPGESMYTMKCDMSGAAAVLAAVRAIALLELPVQVIGYASMAENLPSDKAYRPSDVLTMYGGTTVENVNTDAEGRLVMADALVRASEDAPDLLVDVATLTGACMVALGLRTAGLMASDEPTANAVLDAAESAGESFWELPIPEHLRKGLDSKVADLKSGGSRYGGALTAAAFLQRFVGEGIGWAHLDIAGPAFNEEAPYAHVPTGGTGSAVSTLVALAASLSQAAKR